MRLTHITCLSVLRLQFVGELCATIAAGRHVGQCLLLLFRLLHGVVVRLFVVPLVVQPHELLLALHALVRFFGGVAGHEVPVQIVFEVKAFGAHRARERLVAVVVPELVHLQCLLLAEPLAAHAAPVRLLAAVEPLVVLRLVTLVREVLVANVARDARGFPELFGQRRMRRRRQLRAAKGRRRTTVQVDVAVADHRVVVSDGLMQRQRNRRRWRRRRYGRHHQQALVLGAVVVQLLVLMVMMVVIDARVRAGQRSVVDVVVFGQFDGFLFDVAVLQHVQLALMGLLLRLLVRRRRHRRGRRLLIIDDGSLVVVLLL